LEGCEVLDFFKISIDSAEDACTTLGGAISGMDTREPWLMCVGMTRT
jgi:hypothetical protein